MSIVCMPSFWLTCIVPGIWWIFPSRIRFRIAVVPVMISSAATRPSPVFLLEQRLRHNRFDRFGELRAIWACCAGGKRR
jgi:hypothetical protein